MNSKRKLRKSALVDLHLWVTTETKADFQGQLGGLLSRLAIESSLVGIFDAPLYPSVFLSKHPLDNTAQEVGETVSITQEPQITYWDSEADLPCFYLEA